MPLTGTAIRNARAGGKPVKLFDEGGLYSSHAGRGALVATRLSIRREAAHPVHGRLPSCVPEDSRRPVVG
jgi:hypothetical protein